MTLAIIIAAIAALTAFLLARRPEEAEAAELIDELANKSAEQISSKFIARVRRR